MLVSMKSGLEDRNNRMRVTRVITCPEVSMKSGLEDRNNPDNKRQQFSKGYGGLNEVRPGRPEQSIKHSDTKDTELTVSMKSGLEDRNNPDKYNEALTAEGKSQ